MVAGRLWAAEEDVFGSTACDTILYESTEYRVRTKKSSNGHLLWLAAKKWQNTSRGSAVIVGSPLKLFCLFFTHLPGDLKARPSILATYILFYLAFESK